MSKVALSSALFLILLGGCAQLGTKQDQGSVFRPIVPSDTDPIVDGLRTDVGEIKGLLRELTLLERSRQLVPQISRNPASGLASDDPLAQKVSLEWRGEAAVVVRRVAEVAGWRFATTGEAPLSVVVKVKAVDQPLINVLEDIAVQLGSQADLSVNKSMKTLELRIRG